jgi:methionyl-tRNA formyltransferase
VPVLPSRALQLSKEEARLDLTQQAAVLHNQVRAFAGWPGTFAPLLVVTSSSSGGQEQPPPLQVKVLQSRVVRAEEAAPLMAGAAPHEVVFVDQGKRMLLPCGSDGGGDVLEVLLLQPPTKKAMEPKAFFNGLVGKQLLVDVGGGGAQAAAQQQQQPEPARAA